MTSCACVKAGDVLLGTRDRTVAQLCLLLSWTPRHWAQCKLACHLRAGAVPQHGGKNAVAVLQQRGGQDGAGAGRPGAGACAGAGAARAANCAMRRFGALQTLSKRLHATPADTCTSHQHARPPTLVEGRERTPAAIRQAGLRMLSGSTARTPSAERGREALRAAQTPLLQAIDIEAIDLGTKPPALGGVKSYSSSSDEATIEATLMWGSDARMRVGARVGFESLSLYIPVEVTNVQARAAA